MDRTVLTYGTFDLFHIGHLRLLERLRALGDRLVVGVSTDDFNRQKSKTAIFPYEHRARIVAALRCVDLVIPERSWDQKRTDVLEHGVKVFGIGSDWAGRFDDLRDICEVRYLERTEGVSSTDTRRILDTLDQEGLRNMEAAMQFLGALAKDLR